MHCMHCYPNIISHLSTSMHKVSSSNIICGSILLMLRVIVVKYIFLLDSMCICVRVWADVCFVLCWCMQCFYYLFFICSILHNSKYTGIVVFHCCSVFLHRTKVGELLPRVTLRKIHSQFARAREAEGCYKEAAAAYETAQDWDNAIRCAVISLVIKTN